MVFIQAPLVLLAIRTWLFAFLGLGFRVELSRVWGLELSLALCSGLCFRVLGKDSHRAVNGWGLRNYIFKGSSLDLNS